MKELEYCRHPEGPVRGTWRKAKNPDGSQTARISCPDCGFVASLGPSGHVVALDGSVTPSVVCPMKDDGCSFHDFVKLLDWGQVKEA